MLSSEDPGLQPVKVDINDRRRIEGENLRKSQTPDDGVAERLAKLRADSATQHHRYATKQRRHRGHQDRPKAQHAGLVDRFLRRQTLAMLDLLGKIDQHDAVFLDDADEQDDADNRDHGQIVVNRHQQQQRAEAGRRQGRDDGDRVDHALVEHAEDEVDHEQRCGYQDRRARQGRLEGLGVTLKARLKRERLAQLLFNLPDRTDRLTDRRASGATFTTLSTRVDNGTCCPLDDLT